MRISANQKCYVRYVENHPGASVADVDRACRLNPRAGHKWVYDGVKRLVRRGILEDRGTGFRKQLFVKGLSGARRRRRR